MAMGVGFIVFIIIAIFFLRRDDDLSKNGAAFRNDHGHQDDLDVAVFLVENEHHDDHEDSDPMNSDDFETWDN